jgi:hypothetical protein
MATAAESPSLGTVFSRPFGLTEVWAVGVNTLAKEESWLRDLRLHPDDKPSPAKNKWIYVFNDGMGATGRPDLYAEIFADRNGKLAIVEGRKRLETESDKAPRPSPIPSNAIVLPHTINGDRVYYYFLVARARLNQDALVDLCDYNRDLFIRRDLAQDDAFVKGPDGGDLLPVVDPLTIAVNLHREYERACNEHQYYTVPTERHTPRDAAQVRNRALAYTMAALLKRVTDSNDNLGAKYRGLPERLSGFISDYEQEDGRLRGNREKAARVLCAYLDSRLMSEASAWYPAGKPEHEHWNNVWAFSRRRLIESRAGQAWLEDKLEEADNPKSRDRAILGMLGFLKPEDPLEPLKSPFEAFRKQNAFIVHVYAQIIPIYMQRRKAQLVALAEVDQRRAAEFLKHVQQELAWSTRDLNRFLEWNRVAVQVEVEGGLEKVLARHYERSDQTTGLRTIQSLKRSELAAQAKVERALSVSAGADKKAAAAAAAVDWQEGTGSDTGYKFTSRDASQSPTKENFERGLVTLRVLQSGIEFANFLWTLGKVGNDAFDGENLLALADAMVDATEVFTSVTPDLAKSMGRSHGNMNPKLAGRVSLSHAVGIVGGLIDFAQATIEIRKASVRQDMELAGAQTVVLVGSAAQMVLGFFLGTPILAGIAAAAKMITRSISCRYGTNTLWVGARIEIVRKNPQKNPRKSRVSNAQRSPRRHPFKSGSTASVSIASTDMTGTSLDQPWFNQFRTAAPWPAGCAGRCRHRGYREAFCVAKRGQPS